ncbi:MAG: di-trans,poly-cis-decaprenylcistransferase [Halobacteriovoraceae bacterium]|jgi:undecaprenyl diphosphate synthase|nr:di-trans,poly-cis-decaprenylcistransferase [Halobacteriovoraceae bacterium]MBT5093806.1 di-trans,poly-cis-decaprenylcistransferase [Halobacteriovoraceae bacterium]
MNLKHVAIIMDGNGRWANQRSHQRVWGHVRGSHIVSEIVEEADELGIEALTLYTFSTENWSRPLLEVKILFKLLKKFILKERSRILKNQIRFKVIGDISELPEDTKNLVLALEEETKDLKGLKLTFAFGYGSRGEIIQSVNSFIANNPGTEISEGDITNRLFAPETGDVDLLIRTGGDQRISNFLLWQLAYAELYFTNTQWPEFGTSEFRSIVEEVSDRERRFGSVTSASSLEEATHQASKNKNSHSQSSRI